MKRLLIAVTGVAALLGSGIASAIPYTTGLTLSGATAPITPLSLCVTGCSGEITLDLAVAGGVGAQADGFYDILGVNILINETAGGTPELVFGTLDPNFGNFVQITSGNVGAIYASTTSNNNHTLSFNQTDWVIAPVDPTLPGSNYSAGGSATAIPEPTSIALLGIGLLAFGVGSKRLRGKKA